MLRTVPSSPALAALTASLTGSDTASLAMSDIALAPVLNPGAARQVHRRCPSFPWLAGPQSAALVHSEDALLGLVPHRDR